MHKYYTVFDEPNGIQRFYKVCQLTGKAVHLNYTSALINVWPYLINDENAGDMQEVTEDRFINAFVDVMKRIEAI